MNIRGAKALVTGANRGIGAAFVADLLKRGAARVYAAARDPASLEHVVALDPARVTPVRLDITSPADIEASVETCGDINLLVNNAGVLYEMGYFTGYDETRHAREIETNLWGTWEMCRAFRDVLIGNRPSALLNVASIVAKVNMPLIGPYSASKAALWSLTRGLRGELHGKGVLVVSLFPGLTDTRMASTIDGPKSPPAEVAAAGLDAVANDREDVVACPNAIELDAGLRTDRKAVERFCATLLPAG